MSAARCTLPPRRQLFRDTPTKVSKNWRLGESVGEGPARGYGEDTAISPPSISTEARASAGP